MSVATDLMDKFKQEEQTAAAEAPVETPQPVETSEPETPKEEPKEEPSGNDKPEEPTEEKEPEKEPEPSEEPKDEPKQPKPDFSKLTKEQKAEHAFQRQLAKQKEKHQAEIDDLKKTFQSQFEELKQSISSKKEPEPVKTRSDFDTDDEYIDYLTGKKVNDIMSQRDADAAKAAEEKAQKEKADAEEAARQQEVANYFSDNAKKAFGDAYEDFEKIVKKGVANGLADVLDEAPAVRDFIFGNPDGPILLNEILSNKESFVRVMSRSANPMNAVIECHDLVKEVTSRKDHTETVQAVPKVMPNLGKPGAGAAPSTAPDMWKDDRTLIDFVRRHR